MQSISKSLNKRTPVLPLTVWGQCTCWHHNERNEMLQVSGTGVTTQSSCSLHNNFMEALLQVSTEGILGKRVEEGNFPHACSLFIDWRQHISPRPTAYNLCKVKDYLFLQTSHIIPGNQNWPWPPTEPPLTWKQKNSNCCHSHWSKIGCYPQPQLKTYTNNWSKIGYYPQPQLKIYTNNWSKIGLYILS